MLIRILICGGRDYDEARATELVRAFIKLYVDEGHTIEIISGMAKGADTSAANFGKTHHIKVHEFPADWQRYGRSAGPIRNRQMLVDGRPHIVFALKGGEGTRNMINQAHEFDVYVITENDFLTGVDHPFGVDIASIP